MKGGANLDLQDKVCIVMNTGYRILLSLSHTCLNQASYKPFVVMLVVYVTRVNQNHTPTSYNYNLVTSNQHLTII